LDVRFTPQIVIWAKFKTFAAGRKVEIERLGLPLVLRSCPAMLVDAGPNAIQASASINGFTRMDASAAMRRVSARKTHILRRTRPRP
jgi:hypothetical protein